MSSLDDPRVLFAAERTLLAWQRTSLGLMAFGFVVERFGLFLRMVTGAHLAPADRAFSLWLGVALMTLAVITSMMAVRQYRRVVRELRPNEVPQGYWLHAASFVTLAMAGVAIGAEMYFVIGA